PARGAGQRAVGDDRPAGAARGFRRPLGAGHRHQPRSGAGRIGAVSAVLSVEVAVLDAERITTAADSARSRLAVARDYIALTKPRIIALLEVTALAAMLMAARGWPGTALVVVTM